MILYSFIIVSKQHGKTTINSELISLATELICCPIKITYSCLYRASVKTYIHLHCS